MLSSYGILANPLYYSALIKWYLFNFYFLYISFSLFRPLRVSRDLSIIIVWRVFKFFLELR
jgi:hypothetical protein